MSLGSYFQILKNNPFLLLISSYGTDCKSKKVRLEANLVSETYHGVTTKIKHSIYNNVYINHIFKIIHA